MPKQHPLYSRALATQETIGKLDAPQTMEAMGRLGEIYSAEGNYAAAEPYFAKSLEIKRHQFGAHSLEVEPAPAASRCSTIARDSTALRNPFTWKLCKFASRIWAANDPAVLQTVQFYAALLRQEGRKNEARKLEALSSSRGRIRFHSNQSRLLFRPRMRFTGTPR